MGVQSPLHIYSIPLQLSGAKALVRCDKSTQCWDFSTPDSAPTKSPGTFCDKLNSHHINIKKDLREETRIEDRVTGKQVFTLPPKFLHSECVMWDNQYLIIGSRSGEVLILKYNMSL
jgi:hypothetical protein